LELYPEAYDEGWLDEGRSRETDLKPGGPARANRAIVRGNGKARICCRVFNREHRMGIVGAVSDRCSDANENVQSSPSVYPPTESP